MGNNIASCQPSLTRQSYFPGNPIQGSIKVVATDDVEYYGIRCAIRGVAWYRWETGSGKHRSTHISANVFSKTVITVAGDSEEVAATQKNKYILRKGEHIFPFGALLSPATLPTAAVSQGSTRARIYWDVVAEVDVAGRLNQAGTVEFNVFAPIPTFKWQTPSAKTFENDFDVLGCCHCCCPCCCNHGKIHAKAAIDKSCVVLDRDRLNFTIDINNTQSTEAIEAVNAVLQCFVTPKIGPTQLRPSQIFFNQRIPISVAAGATGQATGTINLAPGAPPTISSAVADYKWMFVAVVEEAGCTTINPRVPIEIELYHTVDDTGAAQYIQQQQVAFQPIMSAEQLNQRGAWEVPNMMMSPNSPAFGQVPPPPPPAGGAIPPWSINNAMQQQNNNNWGQPPGANDGALPPPPPPGGYQQFPGFAQYPDSEYFQQAQQSGIYGPAK